MPDVIVMNDPNTNDMCKRPNCELCQLLNELGETQRGQWTKLQNDLFMRLFHH